MKQKNSKIKNKKGYKRMILKTIASPVIYMLVIVVLSLAIQIMQPKAFGAVVPIVAIMAAYTIFILYAELRHKVKKLDELHYGFSNSIGKSMKHLNVPIMFISNNAKLIWQNSLSSELELEEFIPEIAIEANKSSKKDTIKFEAADKNYLLYTTEIMSGEEVGKLVIFVDVTKQVELEQILDDSRVVVGVITIDSFDDIMQGLDEMDKVATKSGIDTEIVSWIKEYNGIVSKVEKDKYIYFIEKQYVEELEENSFEILEKINKVSEDKVKVPVTISIGLSYDEETLAGRYKSAMNALDVAMGRGGNQAVIKTKKKYDFYGDSGKQQDKTSRVRARMISQALKDVIDKCESVYIMGHKNTDIDCIGAAVGVYKIAKTYGKEAKIICDLKHNNSTKLVIDRLKTAGDYEDVFVTKEDLKKQEFENSLLVVVDTHKASYLAAPDLLEEFDKVVVIDHHRRGPEFIENTILTYHEVYASSTSELVTELLMYLDEVKLTAKEAEAIFSGIVIDTKNFTFKTGVRTFEVSAYLKKTGLDITEVKHVFQNDFETYMAKVNIVKEAEIIDGKIAMSVCSEQHENMSVIAAQAADELLSITGVLASFVLCEIDNVIMISGRSLGDINVQAILEKLGGGGHLTFAGAQMAGVTLEQAKEKLLGIIEEYSTKD